MKSEIYELASGILNEDEFKEAVRLAEIYLQELDSYPFEEFCEFDDKIGIPLPSHTNYPIEYRSIIRSIKFYCRELAKGGITYPRMFVEDVCAHLESCAKLLLEKTESNSKYGNKPLGSVLQRLKVLKIPTNLIGKAIALNNLVYVRAKHDWNIPDSEHLFDQYDAVLIYFAARKLGKELLSTAGIKIPMDEARKENSRMLPRDQLPPAPSFKQLPQGDQKDIDSDL